MSDGIVAITGRRGHYCALSNAGAVKCWGDNSSGQLGAGSEAGFSAIPLQVIGLESGVQEVKAGISHTCAIRKSGRAKCLGDNEYGQLGNGMKGGIERMPVWVAEPEQ